MDGNYEIRLGSSEGFSMLFVCMISKMFCFYLPKAVADFGPSAWIVMLASGAFSAAVFYFFVKSDMNADELLKSVFGGFFGRLLTVAVGVYFVFYTAFNLREIIKVIKIYNFPETPVVVFAAVFVLAAYAVNYNGLYVVGKIAGFYVRIVIIAVVAILLLGMGQYRFEHLTPILGFGVKSIAVGSIFEISLFSDILILMFLVKEAGGGRMAARIGGSAILVSSVCFALSALCYTAVFNYSAAEGKTSGLIEIVKNVYYGQIFQRTESMFFLMMTLISAIAVCVRIFGSVNMLSGAFDIKDKRQPLMIVSAAVFALSTGKFSGNINFIGIALLIILASAWLIKKIRRRT